MTQPERCPKCGCRDSAQLECDGSQHRCRACGYDGTSPLTHKERIAESKRVRDAAFRAARADGIYAAARESDATWNTYLAELARIEKECPA